MNTLTKIHHTYIWPYVPWLWTRLLTNVLVKRWVNLRNVNEQHELNTSRKDVIMAVPTGSAIASRQWNVVLHNAWKDSSKVQMTHLISSTLEHSCTTSAVSIRCKKSKVRPAAGPVRQLITYKLETKWVAKGPAKAQELQGIQATYLVVASRSTPTTTNQYGTWIYISTKSDRQSENQLNHWKNLPGCEVHTVLNG